MKIKTTARATMYIVGRIHNCADLFLLQNRSIENKCQRPLDREAMPYTQTFNTFRIDIFILFHLLLLLFIHLFGLCVSLPEL